MSLIQGGSEIKTTVMDHHGLVAAVCRDLGIVEALFLNPLIEQIEAVKTGSCYHDRH